MIVPISTGSGSDLMYEIVPDELLDGLRQQWWSDQISREMRRLGLEWAKPLSKPSWPDIEWLRPPMTPPEWQRLFQHDWWGHSRTFTGLTNGTRVR